MIGISHLITCSDFGDDRLRGLRLAGSNFFFSLQHSRNTVRVYDVPVLHLFLKYSEILDESSET